MSGGIGLEFFSWRAMNLVKCEIDMSTVPTTAGPTPLVEHDDGVIRVAGTRVTLDTIAAAFNEGATPEEVVQQYPSLALADVYAVVAHYLRHRDAVDEYLAARATKSERVRAAHPLSIDKGALRARLLARRSR